MNTHIEKIRKGLNDIKISIEELRKECPNMGLYINGYSDSWNIDETVNYLELDLNKARLRKIALDKLTLQDKEILGLH